MMVMTAKVDFKKLALVLAAVAAVILVIVLLFGGGGADSAPTAATVSDNDSRLQFLQDMGWEVTETPVQSGQVRIPQEQSEIFDRYNALQKSQGYDLDAYRGKTVMRYVYKINNYPNATDPVYATVLVYKNKIIGGDITDTAAKGMIRGLQKQNLLPAPTQTPDSSNTSPENHSTSPST